MAAHEANGTVLSEQELVDFCIVLLVGGNETTTPLIANAVLCLDEHPEALERLRDDRTLVPSAIEETLRYRSPVQMMRRSSVADTELGGVTIPAGQFILAHLGSANRDEGSFESPEEFRIDRKPNRHIAFGQGIHFCLGAPLARLEAKVALEALLEQLPNLRVAPNTRLDPSPRRSSTASRRYQFCTDMFDALHEFEKTALSRNKLQQHGELRACPFGGLAKTC